ncbi:hypothetical protein ACI8AG_06010 [Blastococcus sp. SYSU DS0552]
MTLDRLNPSPILRAHRKALTRADRPDGTGDWGARGFAWGAALLFVPALIWDWRLAAPEALLAGVSLLAGALLSAFGILATVRLRLQDRVPHSGASQQRAKDLLDESVAHLLAATLACLVNAVLLVVGMNIADRADDPLIGLPAALSIGASAYLAVTFLMLLTRLYATYVDAVQPRDQLNGLVTHSLD